MPSRTTPRGHLCALGLCPAAEEGEGGAVRRAESPFGRVAEPDEIAAAVAFLASPQAEWASGGILDLNGASYLRM